MLLLLVLLLSLGYSVSPSSAALPAEHQWRLALLDECEGFACPNLQAIDFSTWNHCVVTTLNNSGTNSLRDCATRSTSQWITFSVTGTITLDTTIKMTSNKVVDGRGTNITMTTGTTFPPEAFTDPNTDSAIFQIGHYTSGTGTINNIIVTHIKFQDNCANGSIMAMEWAEDIWWHHLTFQNGCDEQMYVGCGNIGQGPCHINTGANRAPRRITISYIHSKQWSGSLPAHVVARTPYDTDCCVAGTGTWPDCTFRWCSKMLLVGSYQDEESQISITMHHVWSQSEARHPSLNNATFHSFNNWADPSLLGPDATWTNL